MPETESPPAHGGGGGQETERTRFEAFYRETYPALLGYLMRRVEDPADAADALAETYAVAWRRHRELPRDDDARPWLFGVARYVVANQRRATRRRGDLTRRISRDVARLTDEAARMRPETTAQESAVRAALARLSEGDRELLTLVAWEALTRDDLAVALGCTRPTARVRLHRARRRFAEALRREGVTTMSPVAPATFEAEEARP